MTNPTNPRQTDEDRELIEEVARALSVPQHHTGWRHLSEMEKDLFYMQAGYALRTTRLESLLSDKAKLEERVRVLEDLPRLIELQRTAAPEHDRDDGWNAGLERAAAMVADAINNKSGQSSTRGGDHG